MAYLSQHRNEDFAPAVILPPDPWNSSVEILEVFKHITPQTPAWVRELYFHHLEALMVQPCWYWGFEQETFTAMLASIEKLEGGIAFLRRWAMQLEVEMRPENQRKGPGFSREMIEQVLKYSGET